jgi:hypothetical protein
MSGSAVAGRLIIMVKILLVGEVSFHAEGDVVRVGELRTRERAGEDVHRGAK